MTDVSSLEVAALFPDCVPAGQRRGEFNGWQTLDLNAGVALADKKRTVCTVRTFGEGMTGSIKDATATEVRRSWATSLNAAADHRPVVFHRGAQDFALLPAPLLRDVLRRAVSAPEVIAEDDGWTVLLPGHPIAAAGATLDEALRDFVYALRDYADAWDDRLHRAPNHQRAAALVQHVCVSDDDELLAWARGPYDQVAPQQA